MNHLRGQLVRQGRVSLVAKTDGIRCGWNHSVKIPTLMTSELVLISLLKRPLTISCDRKA
jgi:hypothetical protein